MQQERRAIKWPWIMFALGRILEKYSLGFFLKEKEMKNCHGLLTLMYFYNYDFLLWNMIFVVMFSLYN